MSRWSHSAPDLDTRLASFSILPKLAARREGAIITDGGDLTIYSKLIMIWRLRNGAESTDDLEKRRPTSQAGAGLGEPRPGSNLGGAANDCSTGTGAPDPF